MRVLRAMGPGYQVRMNRVLRAFMHMRLAGIIEGPDANRYVLHPAVVLAETLRREEDDDEGEEWDERRNPADD